MIIISEVEIFFLLGAQWLKILGAQPENVFDDFDDDPLDFLIQGLALVH